MNYKLKPNCGATGLVPGKVYTEKEINDLPGMGGIARLSTHGTLEPTSEPATSQTGPGDDPLAAHNNTGSPPPLSEEPGKVQEAAVQRGAHGTGDAAERANPATGARGAVKPAKKAE